MKHLPNYILERIRNYESTIYVRINKYMMGYNPTIEGVASIISNAIKHINEIERTYRNTKLSINKEH